MLEIFFKILPIRFYQFFFDRVPGMNSNLFVPHTNHIAVMCVLLSFKNQLELKRHQDIHDTQRPFVCKGCHKIFIRKGILHLRLRLRSEDHPFYCAACNSKLRRTDGVKTNVPTVAAEHL